MHACALLCVVGGVVDKKKNKNTILPQILSKIRRLVTRISFTALPDENRVVDT